jgi:hypothetical protein
MAALLVGCCYEEKGVGGGEVVQTLEGKILDVNSLEKISPEMNSPETNSPGSSSQGENRGDVSGDRFLGRMEAQCDRIRQYRDDVLRKEGRTLSYDEAALEWIERYAEVFAREHGAS